MFVDAHTHLELLALSEVPFHKLRSKEEIINFLRKLDKKYLVAYGLDYSPEITPEDLNRVNYPLLLIYKDGHKGIMNDSMRELLGKDDYFLYEGDLWQVVDKFKPKGERLREFILKGLEEASNMGIFEIHDYVDDKVAEVLFSINPPLRVVLMPYYSSLDKVLESFEKFGERENLRLGWVKVYIDGSISARTAYLKKPYADTKSTGKPMISEYRLARIIKELENRGLRVSMHAIGDGAIELAIRALERAEPSLKYHRIEHAEMITEDQIEKVKELNVLLCMQPNFDCYYRDIYFKALGEERAYRINPIDIVDEIGADLIFGTDMMPFDINYAVECAKKKLPENKVFYYFGGWRKDKNYLDLK
ncbi:MAG TPA: hypothetical protein EYP32_05855 [Aquificaceae bacterium]|nr:hypothetical protein [Aquificaceae bacterium]